MTDHILNPSIYVGSFEWREPVTTLTDFLTALVGFYAFIKFSIYKGKRNETFNYYKYYFLLVFLGMTSAAWLGHGLQAYIDPGFKKVGWVISTTAILLLAFGSLIQIKGYISQRNIKGLKILLIAQYVFFLVLMLYSAGIQFKFAQLASSVGCVFFILPLQFYLYLKTKKKGGLIISIAVLFGAIPGYIFNNKISINRWFNYHDISHVLVAIFIALIFWGCYYQYRQKVEYIEKQF